MTSHSQEEDFGEVPLVVFATQSIDVAAHYRKYIFEISKLQKGCIGIEGESDFVTSSEGGLETRTRGNYNLISIS